MATLRCDTENAVDQVSILDKLRDVLVCHDISQEPVPTKLGTYRINKCELKGQLRDLALTQLRDRGCPHEVLSPLAAAIASAVENSTDDLKGCLPQSAGGGDGPEEYNVLQLHKLILSTIGEFGKKVRGGELDALGFLKGIDGASPRISVASVKNTRRKMEDRFNYVPDLSALYEIQGAPPTSFYGVFDGHAGTDAATYAASLLHERIASSPHYISDLGKAIHDAFTETDAHFCEKKLESGTTAVICLIRGKTLYVAWLGDSQAMLVRGGKPIAVVDPHKPERKDEKLRIENLGGCVIHYGTWRVQGHLAVSRAIGDQQYKPFVTGEPDVEEVGLDGTEDVLVLACDGLWDQVSFPQAVDIVYNHFQKHPRDVEGSSKALVQAARQRGSTDNITVILVCLRDPCLMAAPPAADPGTTTASGLEENGFEREDIPEWARAMKLRYEMEYGMMGASPPHKFNGFQVGPGGDAPPDAAPPAPLQTELDEEEEERRQLAKFMKVHDDEDIEQQPTPEEGQFLHRERGWSLVEAFPDLPFVGSGGFHSVFTRSVRHGCGGGEAFGGGTGNYFRFPDSLNYGQ
ncbi:unnamed protein product [Darwinula stevensoni]|uniref:PPM-type phosphatase domain-containing protein n=1 Tax=Darwinula stevensoni TaxID=69355 RepID=A0A7R9FNF4_9CRUS|nr:unnamed protein product [Darwinula stevensoni]CAG0896738.1 unnamed protein product [Darwinula stevensoni]